MDHDAAIFLPVATAFAAAVAVVMPATVQQHVGDQPATRFMGPQPGGARNPTCLRAGRVLCPGCEDRKDFQRRLFRTWGLAVRDANVERHSTAS
jgi:hypothetical protein